MQIGSDDHLKELSEQLAKLMLKNKLRLAAAESCTGGWLAKCCTDLAGSSSWFDRGFVTYSNDAKHTDLHVPSNTISHYGAVSENTAIAMAEGVLKLSQANISVAITGIAGPSGATATKPVGTVCFAFTLENKETNSLTQYFKGNRERVRRQALVVAFEGIINIVRTTLI
ncbi:MAG: nicotinamide-nucleotide amidase [Methylophagaceae bacterium]|jgi:nicotinamide-nucleotide amidase